MNPSGTKAAILAAALATGLALPHGLEAQGHVDAQASAPEQDAGSGPSSGCFRGRPLPACGSFWLIEMQRSTPLAQTSRTVRWGTNGPEERWDAITQTWEWNLGYMANLTPDFALGALVTIGTGNDDFLTGTKLRARRWLSPNLSLELEGGILWTNAGGPFSPPVSGSTADLRLNFRDQGSFFVRWDGFRLPSSEPILVPGGYGFTDPGGFQHGISVGASAGSTPALIATGAFGLAIIILWWGLSTAST